MCRNTRRMNAELSLLEKILISTAGKEETQPVSHTMVKIAREEKLKLLATRQQ